jgi:uncharacterized membrane protein
MIMHVGFAYQESVGWGADFVSIAAPSWMKRLNEDPVTWARKLAYNVAAYNLMLAVGLGWTCWAIHKRQAIAGPLGMFFAIWLLVAAVAALCTKVFLAFALQGAAGALLLTATIGISRFGRSELDRN